MREYDIVVIGLGPAGLSLLYFLKKFKFNSNILGVEAKRKIGLNKHCAGLVSSSFIKLMWPITKKTIINKLSSFIVTTLSTSKKVYVKLLEEAYVIDRIAYEEVLFENISNFSNYLFGNQATDIVKNTINLGNKEKIKAKVCVIAEGYVHRLRKRILGKKRNERKVFGIQEDIVAKPYDESSFLVVFTDTYAKGFFGWVIPLSEKKVRVGLGGLRVSIRTLRAFEKQLVRRNIISEPVKHGKPYGGVILTSPPEKIDHKGKVIFIGDSGFHVKPITGGGLFIHTLFSKSLAKSIATINNLDSMGFLNKYYGETAVFRRKLRLQGLIARILHELDEKVKTEIIDDISGEEYYLRDYDFHEKDVLSLLTKFSITKDIIKYSYSIIAAFLQRMVQ